MNNPLISICIPSYEANGHGVELLSTNIASCFQQTYTNYEIIISDHSKNNDIKNLCLGLDHPQVKYLHYPHHRGNVAHNTNNAIKHAQGDFIKVMNQDDFFIHPNTLELAVNLIKEYPWVIFSYSHVDLKTSIIKDHCTPSHPFSKINLLKGINSIGNPSCSMFPKGFLMDPEVIYMIDCELYYQLYNKLGDPGIVGGFGIGDAQGPHQLTNQWRDKYKKLMAKDIEYCYNKHLN